MSSFDAFLPKQLQISFLRASSRLYESACPELARSVISKVHDSTSQKPDATRQHCMHCHSPLQPGLCRVKLSPRPRITREIERLKRRLDNPREGSLTSAQRKKVKRWMNSKNTLVICCSFCKKTNRIPCAKRLNQPQSLDASQNTSILDSSSSRKRKRKSTFSDTPSKLTTSSTAGNFVTPPFKKQKRQSSSSSTSTPARSIHGSTSDETKPSSSTRSNRSAKKDKYRQLQTMLKSAKQEQQTKNESPLSMFLTSL